MADAVKQARAGEWPVFVGQSGFAFNGRVHPLRLQLAFGLSFTTLSAGLVAGMAIIGRALMAPPAADATPAAGSR